MDDSPTVLALVLSGSFLVPPLVIGALHAWFWRTGLPRPKP